MIWWSTFGGKIITSGVHKVDIEITFNVLGESTRHEFQAETKMLLDIVAKSLYSEKEVFIRELISNSSDALEKFRYLAVSGDKKIEDADRPLEIHISTDKHNRTLTIQVWRFQNKNNKNK